MRKVDNVIIANVLNKSHFLYEHQKNLTKYWSKQAKMATWRPRTWRPIPSKPKNGYVLSYNSTFIKITYPLSPTVQSIITVYANVSDSPHPLFFEINLNSMSTLHCHSHLCFLNCYIQGTNTVIGTLSKAAQISAIVKRQVPIIESNKQ